MGPQRMRTLKDTRLGNAELRLVDMGGGLFVARALVNGTEKLRFEGKTADEAWMRLHDEIGKANPKYVGYDGARNRFLHFFPNGFHSEGYAAEERKYKVAAKDTLDRSVPVTDAVDGSGFSKMSWRPSETQTCCSGSRRPEFRKCSVVLTPIGSFVPPPNSRWEMQSWVSWRWSGRSNHTMRRTGPS